MSLMVEIFKAFGGRRAGVTDLDRRIREGFSEEVKIPKNCMLSRGRHGRENKMGKMSKSLEL